MSIRKRLTILERLTNHEEINDIVDES